jgi:hypothetical protein
MANEGRYHPGAVKPNDSRLLSPAKKKALFASMGAKISDQKHTQEPPPPRAAARPLRPWPQLRAVRTHSGLCLCRPRRDIQPNPTPRCPPQDAHTAADDSFLSPGRRLSTTCTFNPTQVDEFTSEVGNLTGACGIIELESGVYNLTQTLTIARDLTIRAQTEAPGSAVGTVVLDGQNSVRVFYITSGKVSLIGLDITNGKSSEVCRAVGNALASARNPGRLAR